MARSHQREKARELLGHYFGLAIDRELSSNSYDEIDTIVDCIVDAAVEEAKAEIAAANLVPVRTPIGVSVSVDSVNVVCDDGTVWVQVHGQWVEDTAGPIPGTRAEADLVRGEVAHG